MGWTVKWGQKLRGQTNIIYLGIPVKCVACISDVDLNTPDVSRNNRQVIGHR